MNNIFTIDINCDLGEGPTLADSEQDALLMPYISSCNIACGGHAGSRETIEASIKNAVQHQLKIGAHPGYPDQEHFGRRSLGLSANEVVDSLRQQLELFVDVVNKNSASLHHIKLHGALYNDVEHNRELADVIAEYFFIDFPDIPIYGLAHGLFQKVCEDKRLSFIPEGFMDRRYQADGKLTPRTESHAVITQTELSLQQAIALAKKQAIETSSGEFIMPSVETICLHGDNENALAIARQLHQTLADHGIVVQ